MKMDRLIGILILLMRQEKTTAPELAARFEVSRRTILRDIDALCRAGVPIVTAQGGGGGISIMEGYKIRQNVLTADELQSLISALKGLDSVSKTSQFERLMAKLAPDHQALVSLGQSIVIDLSSFHRDSLAEKIDCLKEAIAKGRAVSFDYYYDKGEVRRLLEPYWIEFRWEAWYVFGWCPGREDFRRFKLGRLCHLTLTDQHFVPRSVPPMKASAEDAFPDLHRITILFEKSAKYRLIEAYGLDCYEETERGLLFSTGYANKDHMLRWILGFGYQAEIMDPPEIREEFAELTKKMAQRYTRT